MILRIVLVQTWVSSRLCHNGTWSNICFHFKRSDYHWIVCCSSLRCSYDFGSARGQWSLLPILAIFSLNLFTALKKNHASVWILMSLRATITVQYARYLRSWASLASILFLKKAYWWNALIRCGNQSLNPIAFLILNSVHPRPGVSTPVCFIYP